MTLTPFPFIRGSRVLLPSVAIVAASGGMSSDPYDAVIIGGGPGGSCAATRLALAGR